MISIISVFIEEPGTQPSQDEGGSGQEQAAAVAHNDGKICQCHIWYLLFCNCAFCSGTLYVMCRVAAFSLGVAHQGGVVLLSFSIYLAQVKRKIRKYEK